MNEKQTIGKDTVMDVSTHLSNEISKIMKKERLNFCILMKDEDKNDKMTFMLGGDLSHKAEKLFNKFTICPIDERKLFLFLNADDIKM